MQIVVIASGEDQKEFQDKEIPAGILVQFVTTVAEAKEDAAGYFYLLGKEDLVTDRSQIEKIEAPVFVKASVVSLEELPSNCATISGWPGFLFEDIITVHVFEKNLEKVTTVLDGLQWKFKPVLIR